MKISYKWELRHRKGATVQSNDIKELQKLQGLLGGFIFRLAKLKETR